MIYHVSAEVSNNAIISKVQNWRHCNTNYANVNSIRADWTLTRQTSIQLSIRPMGTRQFRSVQKFQSVMKVSTVFMGTYPKKEKYPDMPLLWQHYDQHEKIVYNGPFYNSNIQEFECVAVSNLPYKACNILLIHSIRMSHSWIWSCWTKDFL